MSDDYDDPRLIEQKRQARQWAITSIIIALATFGGICLAGYLLFANMMSKIPPP